MIGFNWGSTMFSRLGRLLVLVGVMVSLGACSGEDEPYQTPPVVKMSESQCLDKADETLNDYMDGRLNAAEINAFWNCTQRALDVFLRFTNGRQVGLYSAKELRNFLQTFFMGDLRINDVLLEELMEVKRVFLSGSREFVTRKELIHTQEIIEEFRKLSLDLNPHIQVVRGEFYRHRKSYSVDQLDQSLEVLSGIMSRFAKIIGKRGQAYEFSRFERLLTEIGKLVDGRDRSRANLLRELIPWISQVKLQLVGSPQDRVQPKQWAQLGTIIAEGMGLWMRYEHFTAHRGWSEDPQMMEQAFASMQQAAKRLGGEFSRTDQSLDWVMVDQLIQQLDTIISKHSVNMELHEFLAYLPLVSELKYHLVGGSRVEIAPADWPNFMTTVAQLSEIGLRFAHLVVPNQWDRGVGLEQLDKSVLLGLNLISESIDRKPEKMMSFEDVNSIVSALDKAKLIPMGIGPSSIEETLPVLANRLMRSPQDRLAGDEIDGLDLKTFAYLKAQWQGWKKAQDYMNGFMAGQNPDPGSDPILLEMQQMMSGPWPLVHDQKGRLRFEKPKEMEWTHDSLTQLNWSRSLLRLFVLGYAEDEDRINLVAGLTLDELDYLAGDVLPIGVDLGVFREDDYGIADRIFVQADLFMPRSNGNELLDLAEGVEYLSYVLSGIAAGSEFLQVLPEACHLSVETEQMVEAECFRKAFGEDRLRHLGHMPFFNLYADTLSSELWGSFVGFMELAVRGETLPADPISTSDIKEAFALIQFMEGFFARFNQDVEPWYIDVEESLNAFPVFDLPLLNLLGFAERSDREALFTYMMKNGRPPKQDIEGLKDLQAWKAKKEEWSFSADRVRLMRILAELSKSM